MKTYRFFWLLLFAIPAATAWTQEVTLNDGWYYLEDQKYTLAGLPATDEWIPVNLPHTWNQEDPYDEADGYRMGEGWYRKSLYLDKSEANQIHMHFEGINEHAVIYLNGQKIDEHLGGYTAFTVDLTPAVIWGEENDLLIWVSNRMNASIPPLSMDFTFFGGIYRDVYLIRSRAQHFNRTQAGGPGVTLSTPRVSERSARLQAIAHLVNTSSKREKLEIRMQLQAPDGKQLSSSKEKVTLKAGQEQDIILHADVDQPRLWSPVDPALYRVTVTLVDPDTDDILDRFSAKRGFRWVSRNENGAFMLNGEPLKLLGSCRHQEYPGFGSAMPDRLHRRDIELLKAIGGNFIRIAHYPQDPAILEACDELGILAWEELPIVNSITASPAFRDVSFQMMKEMVTQHRNHTSVIMWGLANEILLGLNRGLKSNDMERDAYLSELRAFLVDLNKHTKSLDPDRWTTIAHHGRYELYEDANLNTITDVVGLNLYYGWYSEGIENAGDYMDRFHRDHPDKGIILSEYGGGSDPRIHALEPRRFDFSIEWQTRIHSGYLPQIRARDHVMGSALWILNDFSSEGRKDAVPHINSKGILTHHREPKDSYLYYQAAGIDASFLKIGSRGWNWRAGVENDRKQVVQPVYIFSNQNKIAVWLNGEMLGDYAIENYHAVVQVPFQKGENLLEVKSGSLSDLAAFQVETIPANLIEHSSRDIAIRMNLGAHFYFVDDLAKEVWIPEQPYQKGGAGYIGGNRLMSWNGARVGIDKEIFGSPNEPLYQTHRDSIQSFRADLPPGRYEVTLHFAETYGERERENLIYNLGADDEEQIALTGRRFHIYANGQPILQDITLLDFQATAFTFAMFITDGEALEIELVPVTGSAFLSAIEIIGND